MSMCRQSKFCFLPGCYAQRYTSAWLQHSMAMKGPARSPQKSMIHHELCGHSVLREWLAVRMCSSRLVLTPRPTPKATRIMNK